MNIEKNNINIDKVNSDIKDLFLEAIKLLDGKVGFNTVELQRDLKCSFHNVMLVIDALKAQDVISENESAEKAYKYIVNQG